MGSYGFIQKDYGIKNIEGEKIEKHQIMYLDMEDKEYPLYIHHIYGNIDLKKLGTNESYKNYIVNLLFHKDKLKRVSENLYGYIGEIIEKDNKYNQQCNFNILQRLREKSERNKLYFKASDNSTFSLKGIYKKEVNTKILDVYEYEKYDKNGTSNSRSNIITNINMERLKTNKNYRDIVFNKYLNIDWIRKCVERKDGYIGNPEEEYIMSKASNREL